MYGVEYPGDADEAFQPQLIVAAVRLQNEAMSARRISLSEIGLYLIKKIQLDGADSP